MHRDSLAQEEDPIKRLEVCVVIILLLVNELAYVF